MEASMSRAIPLSTDPEQSLTSMRQRALDRQDRYRTFVVEELPRRREIHYPHIEGGMSKIVLAHGIAKAERYVKKDSLIDLGDGVKELPTTAARDYLAAMGYKSTSPRSAAKDLLQETMKLTPALPGYVKPAASDEGYYIDIRRCFLAIMCMAGWDVSYSPGQYVLKGVPPLDFPLMESSIARNSLVTNASNHILYKIDPPDWLHKPLTTYNKLYNLQINAFIRDTLHSIAWLAREEGAVYIATDGFIAPNYRIAKAISGIVEDFGLAFSVKASGKMDVRGAGNYRVGNHRTKVFNKRRDTGSIVGLRDVSYRRWLQANLSSLAASDGALHLVSDKL